MKKVLIAVSGDTLLFSYYKKEITPSNLDFTNTNIIKNDELVFSMEYILTNQKILSYFLNDLMSINNINKIIIANYELTKEILPLINNLSLAKVLKILEERSLPYSLCELITENNNLELVNIASAPPYMLEMLDKSNLKVETRSEILFTSEFMATNNLSVFSNIFYKTSIRIEKFFLENDFVDFDTFCKINNYLKTIHLYVYDEVMLRKIGEILRDARIKKIKILLHLNITSKEDALKLKNIKNEFNSKYKIDINVVYTDSYLKDNLFAHLILTVFKTIALVIIIIVIAVMGTIMFNNYLSEKKVSGITDELDHIISEAEKNKPKEEKPEETLSINSKFEALLEVNSDTVGWLKVNNTKIDYPVVRTGDNNFYLTHDYYQNKEYNGWVFMDYRNPIEELNKNTIIYGHNRFQSGVMFGTLQNAMKKDWYENEENLIIKFETLYEELEWEIFSIYKTKNTIDYIETKFESDDKYFEFLEMIQSRSINFWGVELSAEDKILTLSTCMDQNNRLVVHAKLKK